MATSKKVTDLVKANTAANTDLLYVVKDPTGTPTSNSVSVGSLMTSNLNTSFSNVTAANILAGSGVVLANSVTINYKTTPSSNTDVPTGASNNTIWTDGTYIYVVANTAATTGKVKRVLLSDAF